MIRVSKHPSFNKWYQVYAFGTLLEEIDSKRKALRLAAKTAREHGACFYMLDEVPVEV